MNDADTGKRFSLGVFVLSWLGLAVVTWLSGCLLVVILMHHELHSGLVPLPVLAVLGFFPVSGLTLIVHGGLFVAGRKIWPDSLMAPRLLLYLGTPLLTLLCLWLLTLLVGGVDFFIPRM